jgi:hypothetical protein
MCELQTDIFIDEISGDELLSDSFPYKEIENGILWEVEGKVGTLYLLVLLVLLSMLLVSC